MRRRSGTPHVSTALNAGHGRHILQSRGLRARPSARGKRAWCDRERNARNRAASAPVFPVLVCFARLRRIRVYVGMRGAKVERPAASTGAETSWEARANAR